jgi:hypothetical protein
MAEMEHGAQTGRGARANALLDWPPRVDSLPPPPPQPTTYVYAPGDIYPLGSREEDLCREASRPDWIYLAGLAALDVAAFSGGSADPIKFSDSVPVRLMGPTMIGLAWGATLGGWWLALPKCAPHWVESPPREGDVRATWPVALSLAVLAGVTAPIANGVALQLALGSCVAPQCQGGLPASWSTEEREMHLVVAGVAGFGGALLPYVLPPRTWSAARAIERLRVMADGRGAFVAYAASF